MNASLRAVVIGAFAALVACKDGGGGADGPPTVGPGGGTVSLAGGPSLTIPPNALGADTAIAIQQSATAPPAGAITPLFLFEPEGTSFLLPATVAFSVPTGTQTAAVYWTKAGSSTEFEPLVTVLAGTTATAEVNHLSRAYVGPAPASTHAISGTVSGEVAEGVTLTLTGAPGPPTTTTDAGGHYAFTGLSDRAYTVTPSLAGFSFSPASRSVQVSGADVGGCDFTATRLPSDTTPPTVTSTVPPNETATFPVWGSVSATFSEPVDCSTVTAESFTLVPLRGDPIAGTVSCSGQNATFDPAKDLTSGTDLVARLTTAVKDRAGNAMAAPHGWFLRTSGGLSLSLSVDSTVPARDAFGAAIDAPVTATFSALLRCATVTTSSFTLAGPSGPIAGTVSCSGTSVSFTPAAALAQGAVHTATLTSDVRSLGNSALFQPYTWSFTTLVQPAGAWGAPVLVDTTAGLSDWPRLAVGANGFGAAAWSDWIGEEAPDHVTRIRAALLEPDGSWGTAATLASRGQYDYSVYSARVAVDASGQALAVWLGPYRIPDVSWHQYVFASVGTPGGGWSSEMRVEDTDRMAYAPGFPIELAMNGAGDAMAVHTLSGPTGPADSWMVGIPWPAGGTVGAAAWLAATPDTGAFDPAVVVDGDGVATAAWRESGTAWRILAARHVPGVGWGAPAAIDDGAGSSSRPSLAADGAGRVLAAWVQSVSGVTTTSHVFAARYLPGAGWSTPQDLEPAATPGSSGPAVALNATGQGLVVWVSGGDEVYAVRVTPEGVFSSPERLDIATYAADPGVAIDPAGNGMAVWTRTGDNFRAAIYASRYTAGVGWSTRQPIGLPLDTGPGGATRARVAVDALGRFSAVWMRNEPSGYGIWARRWQ